MNKYTVCGQNVRFVIVNHDFIMWALKCLYSLLQTFHHLSFIYNDHKSAISLLNFLC
jgi:hypothetical protein